MYALKFTIFSLLLITLEDEIIHFNVTAYPTAQWGIQQLREAFPFDIKFISKFSHFKSSCKI